MKKVIVKHDLKMSSNLTDFEKYIEQHIKKYDMLIQEDELPSTKKVMALINNEKKEFSDQCKTLIDDLLKPVEGFKIIQKRIEQMFIDSRLQLKLQVDKFEEAHKLDIKKSMELYRDGVCKLRGVDTKLIPVDHYVKLTAVTQTGSLTTKVKDELDTAINCFAQLTIEQEKRDKLISDYPHHKSNPKRLLKLLKKLRCDKE